MAKQTFTTGQVLTAAQMTSLQQTAMGGGSTTAKVASYVLVAADAGTVVQMNAAGATTITVNTALFAAGDTVEIQNVGAGVCTVTAGTATVSTSSVLTLQQFDAGSLYFNSTSAAIFFASDAANSPLTTKGDLYTFSTADARIAVGNNGETLVADSAAATGLRYSATPSASNPVLNSAMQNWQRGTSITTASATYTADRWYASAASAGTVTRQATGDTTNLPFIQYAARFQRTAASTSLSDLVLSQSFETVNSIPFAGKAVTMSFYARRGTNFSGASNNLSVFLVTGTGTDQNQITGYTGQATPINSTAALTTTWQRFTYTGTVAATATELAVLMYYTPVGTAGAADYYEVTGVQIDIGSVALPFRTYAATIQGELAACQRYYYRQSASATAPYLAMGTIVFASGATTADGIQSVPVTMRIAPTSIDYSTLGVRIGVGTIFAITSLGFQTVLNGANTVKLDVVVASGLTSNSIYYLIANNSASAYLGYSAEL